MARQDSLIILMALLQFQVSVKYLYPVIAGVTDKELVILTDCIAISQDNKLFVCDTCNHRIQVFDTNLKFVFSFVGSGEGEMISPYDLTFDPAGSVYVADRDNHRVQVFSQNGTYLRTFGVHGSGPGELSYPRGIHVDHGHVYVAEKGNNRISTFHTSGAFITSFGRRDSGGELQYPRGITTDQDGFLYVCNTGNYRIQVF